MEVNFVKDIHDDKKVFTIGEYDCILVKRLPSDILVISPLQDYTHINLIIKEVLHHYDNIQMIELLARSKQINQLKNDNRFYIKSYDQINDLHHITYRDMKELKPSIKLELKRSYIYDEGIKDRFEIELYRFIYSVMTEDNKIISELNIAEQEYNELTTIGLNDELSSNIELIKELIYVIELNHKHVTSIDFIVNQEYKEQYKNAGFYINPKVPLNGFITVSWCYK